MGISISGMGSGMDIQSIVSQLMAIERQPIYQMQQDQAQYQREIDVWQEINTSISALNDKVEALLEADTYNPIKVVIGDEDLLNVTASDGAIPGNYNIEIIQLATNTSVTSQSEISDKMYGKASVGGISTNTLEDISITDGQIIITQNNIDVSIDISSTDTIQATVDNINNALAAAGLNNTTVSYDDIKEQLVIETLDPGSITLNAYETNFFEKMGFDEGTYLNNSTVDLHTKLSENGITGLTVPGSFKINGVTFSYDSETTLGDILENINNSDAGVTAFYDQFTNTINISNKDTGNSSITFSDETGNFLDTVNILTAPQNLGKNSQIKINGVTTERSSNTFEINGIKYELLKTGSTNVKATKDVDAVYESIKGFVDQYNSTIDLINTKMEEENGPLRGDSTLRTIKSNLRTLISEKIEGTGSKYSYLFEIGIETESTDFGKSGRLEIDEDTLKEIIEQEPNELKMFFFNDLDKDDAVDDGENGFFAELYNQIESIISDKTQEVGSVIVKTGIIPEKIDSLQDIIDSYNDRIEDFNRRMEDVEKRYYRQFNQMDQALVSLQNQSAWLQGQLSSLVNYSSLLGSL
jgi:flagellar hook-associated protein 2